ncbi:MAG: thiamine-phosphate kinase [Pseudomonadota bacterium]
MVGDNSHGGSLGSGARGAGDFNKPDGVPSGAHGQQTNTTAAGAPWLNDDELIANLFAPLAEGHPASLGLLDDVALIDLADGGQAVHQSVISTDSIVAGLHLPATADPADVAWKSLAVNVSDIVAKGAAPSFYLLNVAVPRRLDWGWLQRFAEGLAEAQKAFQVTLVGGDTDLLPFDTAPVFSIGVTMIGSLSDGAMVPRKGAQPGDKLVVTGPIGNAAIGLLLELDDGVAVDWPIPVTARENFLRAYTRPHPNLGVAGALLAHAKASLDVSDGLVKDAFRLAKASGCGVQLRAEHVPIGLPARLLVGSGTLKLEQLLSGGEDYCVAAAVAADSFSAFEKAVAEAGSIAVDIGAFVEDPTCLTVLDGQGQPMEMTRTGWDHTGG